MPRAALPVLAEHPVRHVHLSEQTAENADCLAVHGCTPTSLLDEAGFLGRGACAVHATFDDGSITLRAFFGELEGDRSIRVTRSGRDADVVIDEVYLDLVDQGAMDLVVTR